MDTAKYTNRFTVVANPQSSEFIVTFYQTMPEIDDNGNVIETNTVEVGRYVMNMKLAEQFSQNISELIARNKSENER